MNLLCCIDLKVETFFSRALFGTPETELFLQFWDGNYQFPKPQVEELLMKGVDLNIYRELEDKIGVQFKNKSLLIQVLSSYAAHLLGVHW